MDVHTWAAQVASSLNDRQIHEIVADGAEGLLDTNPHCVPPGLDPEDRRDLLEEVERICQTRVAPLE